MCVLGAIGGEGACPLDECVAAGIGVGVDEDQLARCLGESSEERVGFRVGVAKNGDRVPCRENVGRGELEVEARFELGAVRRVLNGEGDRARAHRRGGRARALRPWR